MLNFKEFVDFVWEGIQESPFKDLGLKEDIEDEIKVFLNDPDRVFLVSFDKEKERFRGFLAGLLVTQHPIWRRKHIATEMFWYVHPDYRNAGVAQELLTDWEKWARDKGATHISMAGMNNDSLSKVDHLYQKFGYKMIEVSYMKELI